MNVLYLHCHDAGRLLSPYGHKLPTPRIEAFAREACLFRNAHCAAPTCSPSRAALLTGRNAHAAGMLGLRHRGFSLAQPETHLAAFLGAQGYETVLSGVQHEFNAEDPKPYQRMLPWPQLEAGLDHGTVQTRLDAATAANAAAWLRGPHDQPFFLACGFLLPHREFPADILPGWEPDYLGVPAGLPDTPEVRLDHARYATAVSRLDACVGRVLDALEETGLAANTLVVFTTDHGVAFPGHKCRLNDRGTGVALMIRVPGSAPRVGACDALVSHLDVYPTVCDYLGLARPVGLEGCSLRPLLEYGATSVRTEVFSEVSYHAGYEPMRSIRTERHRLVRHYPMAEREVPTNIDDSLSKEAFRAAGGMQRVRAREVLYDLFLDPAESCNVAQEPAYAEVYKQLAARLDDWMRSTRDPLVTGSVAAPEGAVVNPPNQYSPGEPTVAASAVVCPRLPGV